MLMHGIFRLYFHLHFCVWSIFTFCFFFTKMYLNKHQYINRPITYIDKMISNSVISENILINVIVLYAINGSYKATSMLEEESIFLQMNVLLLLLCNWIVHFRYVCVWNWQVELLTRHIIQNFLLTYYQCFNQP